MIRQLTLTSRQEWRTHHAVMDAARALGACFQCATLIGFYATTKPEERTPPKLHPRCERGMQAAEQGAA